MIKSQKPKKSNLNNKQLLRKTKFDYISFKIFYLKNLCK